MEGKYNISSNKDFSRVVDCELGSIQNKFIINDLKFSSNINKTSKQFIDYYEVKRLDIINNLNPTDYFFSVEFTINSFDSYYNDYYKELKITAKILRNEPWPPKKIKPQKDIIKINKSDLQNCLFGPNIKLSTINNFSTREKTENNTKIINEVKSELQKEYYKILDNIINCVKLAYYNLRLENFKQKTDNKNKNFVGIIYETIEGQNFFLNMFQAKADQGTLNTDGASYIYHKFRSYKNTENDLFEGLNEFGIIATKKIFHQHIKRLFPSSIKGKTLRSYESIRSELQKELELKAYTKQYSDIKRKERNNSQSKID